MIETYADELREFANFYFKNIFKGLVIVDSTYEPRGMYSSITVKINYNEVNVSDVSYRIEDYTHTLSVMDILDELADRLKTQYENKLYEKENIFKERR